MLTARKNVIVFVDEVHRSQYGFGAKIDTLGGQKHHKCLWRPHRHHNEKDWRPTSPPTDGESLEFHSDANAEDVLNYGSVFKEGPHRVARAQ